MKCRFPNCHLEATHGVSEASVCGTHAAPYGVPPFLAVVVGPSAGAVEFNRQVDAFAHVGKLFLDCLTEDDPLQAIDRQQGTNLAAMREDFRAELGKIRAGAHAVTGGPVAPLPVAAAPPLCGACAGQGKLFRAVSGAPGELVEIPCPSCAGLAAIEPRR